MNNEELKEALRSGVPVVYVDMYGRNHKYGKIQAIRLHKLQRYSNGRKLCVSAELLDENNNSVTVVPAERVKAIGSEEYVKNKC